MEFYNNFPEWKKNVYRLLCAPLARWMLKNQDRLFMLWEDLGLHVLPNHFYTPIPDTRLLPSNIVDSNLTGIDMNDTGQKLFLHNTLSLYKDDFHELLGKSVEANYGFHLGNGRFDGLDALVAYAMVRKHKPRRVIEVGSGMSTRILSLAGRQAEGELSITCIEPFPDETLGQVPGVGYIYESPVEELDIDLFDALEKGDILFIDSSHTIRTSGDVLFLFLEVLPRLKKGVLVHVHDIFLPLDYPRNWLVNEHRFWCEQYLLQAFLVGNVQFRVYFANSYMGLNYPIELKSLIDYPGSLEEQLEEEYSRLFPGKKWWGGGSIWLEKV